jgi:hypothetical protein
MRAIVQAVTGRGPVRAVAPGTAADDHPPVLAGAARPFPDVAVHVVQTPGVGQVAADGRRQEMAVVVAVSRGTQSSYGPGLSITSARVSAASGAGGVLAQPDVAQVGVLRVIGVQIAEEERGRRAGAARPLPLLLGGQREHQPGGLAQPAAESVGLVSS